MRHEVLHIFTHFGSAYTFKDVEIICSNETTLQFSYVAMSDGKEKIATFPKSNICGWAFKPVKGK